MQLVYSKVNCGLDSDPTFILKIVLPKTQKYYQNSRDLLSITEMKWLTHLNLIKLNNSNLVFHIYWFYFKVIHRASKHYAASSSSSPGILLHLTKQNLNSPAIPLLWKLIMIQKL